MISISDHNISKVVQFDGTNFGNWKYRLGILLDEKGLKKYIEEDLADILTAADADQRSGIRKEEKKCISFLVQSIHDSQLEYVKDKERAKAMFDSLAAVFERKSIAGQLLLRKQLLMMKMNDGQSISEHFLKFDKHIRDLKAIGAKMEEMDVVCHLLLTMPKRFDTVVTTIETMNTRDVTMDFVKSRLMDENSKRNVGSSGKSSESYAMNAKRPDIICFKCQKPGHIKSQCQWKGNQFKKKSKFNKNVSANNASEETSDDSILCAVAGDSSVEANTCVETVGAVAHKVTIGNDDVTHIKFVLDSGATEHMANEQKYFNTLNKVNNIPITIAKKNENMIAKRNFS